MKLTLNIETPEGNPHVDSVRKLVTQLGQSIADLTESTVTFDQVNNVRLLHDMAGSAHIWAIYLGDQVVWSHTSLNGAPPDAIEVWNALASHLPMYDTEDA